MPYLQSERTKIPDLRFYGGLFLGLSFGVIFYHFSILGAELLRFMAMDYYFQFWPLATEERLFFKLFFAALGFIGGLGIVLEIWFYKARSFGSKIPFSRSRIYNDHRVLQWSFLHWFFKLGYLYISFLGWTFFSPEDSLSFYENYFWLFPSLLLVLFLNMWKSLLLKYRGVAFKYMGLSALLIMVLSGLLSQWDWVNTPAIEAKISAKNPYERFQVQIPISRYGERDSSYRAFYQEYFLVPSDSTNFDIYKSRSKRFISKGRFVEELHDASFFKRHYIPSFHRLRWVVDEDLAMKTLIQAHFLLPEYQYNNSLNYAVRPKPNTKAVHQYNFPVYYYGSGVAVDLDIPLPPPSPIYIHLHKQELKLKPGGINHVIVNGQDILLKDLKPIILERLENKAPLGFHFSGWEDERFGTYFRVLESIRQTLNEALKHSKTKQSLAINIRFDDKVAEPPNFDSVSR